MNNLFCSIRMDKNPGKCTLVLTDDKGDIKTTNEIKYATSNLAEYLCLVFSLYDSLKSNQKTNIVTTNQVAFIWFTKKKAQKNTHVFDEKSQTWYEYEVEEFDEAKNFNEGLLMPDVKEYKKINYVKINDNVNVLFAPKKLKHLVNSLVESDFK